MGFRFPIDTAFASQYITSYLKSNRSVGTLFTVFRSVRSRPCGSDAFEDSGEVFAAVRFEEPLPDCLRDGMSRGRSVQFRPGAIE